MAIDPALITDEIMAEVLFKAAWPGHDWSVGTRDGYEHKVWMKKGAAANKLLREKIFNAT